MPIELGNQSNIPANTPPSFQEWHMSPPGAVVSYYQGGDIPETITIQTRFKDVIGTSAATGLSNFKYRTFISPETAIPECIAMAGLLHTGATSFADYENGIEGEMIYSFQNVNLLPVGGYIFTAYHRIYGSNSSGLVMISEKKVTFQFLVFAANATIVSPQSFNIQWTIGQLANVVIPITVSGPLWYLKCPPGFNFTGSGIGINPSPEGGYIASGAGAKNFNLVCTTGIEPVNITQNPLNLILAGNDNSIQLPIKVTFMNASGFFQGKDYLHFVAYKGVQDAPPQYVHMAYSGEYYFVCPPWASVLPSAAAYTVNAGFIVINSDNLQGGHYSGQVEIRASSGGALLGVVDIEYDVIDNVGSPYEQGRAFTLDPKFIELVSQLDNTYFEVKLSARVYEFYTGIFKDLVANFKYPLLNRRQRFNIGQVVDRMMFEMPDFTNDNETPYSAADVQLEITEKSYTDPLYAQLSVLQLQFIAGLEPELVSGSGFLDVNTGASRVTANGYYYLNMFIVNSPTLKVIKNGGVVNYFEPQPGIRSLKIPMSNYNAAQGDVFEFRLEATSGTVSKFLKVFPEGYHSNYIVWQNEYKLKSVMEFHGDYTLKSEFENRNQTLLQQLVEVTYKLESRKSAKLNINTGWLLKSEIPSVESLCRSKRAVLVLHDKHISLVPSQKSINNVDANQGLISFDIEFDVNRSFNEEIHSF